MQRSRPSPSRAKVWLAPAKINLALHVTGQRADGYHLLDSIVAFAGVGDELAVAPSDSLSLVITGPHAAALPVDDDNLVLRAARLLWPDGHAAINLTKNLPIASGIGGGSADAAAALTALSWLWNRPLPDRGAILRLGADVPACLNGKPARMSGIGDRLTPIRPLPETHVVLVNPGVGVATPAVFKALNNRHNPPLPADVPYLATAPDLAGWLALQRNDLEAPAIALAPVIADVKAALTAQPGCLLARMSGSGATCFGIFDSAAAAALAQAALRAKAGWWVAKAPLLS